MLCASILHHKAMQKGKSTLPGSNRQLSVRGLGSKPLSYMPSCSSLAETDSYIYLVDCSSFFRAEAITLTLTLINKKTKI